MNWNTLVHGSEVVAGVALFVGLVVLIWSLSPPAGQLQERRIVSFPGAWIIVGLPLTFGFGISVALVAVGLSLIK
jgi:hypothetical protein